MGPRYQIVVLPLYFIALGAVVADLPWRRWTMGLFAALLLVSVANMHVIAAVSTTSPGVISPPWAIAGKSLTNQERFMLNPLKYWYRSYARGYFQQWPYGAIREHHADNRAFTLGRLLHLGNRFAAIIPLLLILAGGLWMWFGAPWPRNFRRSG